MAIKEDIDSADVGRLHSSLTKEELSKALVAQYLSHDGYNETAKAFAQEIRSENQSLLGTHESSLDSYLAPEEDHDAAHRQSKFALLFMSPSIFFLTCDSNSYRHSRRSHRPSHRQLLP